MTATSAQEYVPARDLFKEASRVKWTLAYAVAFAVAATTTAFTLVPGSHTSAGVTEAAAQILPAQNVMDHPRGTLVVMPLTTWTVGKGDTLSGIAKTRYGKEAAWPLIYWANHKQVKWANRIQVGQTLQLPIPDGPIPAPPRLLQPPPPPIRHILVSYSAGPVHRVYQATYSPSGTYSGSGSMERCIISRESGGNSQVMNSSGHYGLYQFSYSTWVGSGGSGASFGHASVAEQQQVFRNAVAARGYSDWAPYDGC